MNSGTWGETPQQPAAASASGWGQAAVALEDCSPIGKAITNNRCLLVRDPSSTRLAVLFFRKAALREQDVPFTQP